jgi:DNA-binding NarL/FixJ family response regulator
MTYLVVEDMESMAKWASTELRRDSKHEVHVASDPREGIRLLSKYKYDAMLVDMLFDEHTQDFKRRLRSGRVRLSDPELHLSGLALIYAARQQSQGPKPILWTTGEDNRHLHLQFAYEELGVRVFCSKKNTGQLARAVEHACMGREFIDPPLAMYVSGLAGSLVREALLEDLTKLKIWRLHALGMHQQQKIAKEVGLSHSATRSAIGSMRRNLLKLDKGLDERNKPAGEIIRYSGQNWEFFLDDTVKRMYP